MRVVGKLRFLFIYSMKLLHIISSSEKQTKKIAHDLARALLHATSSKCAVVVALQGELGSGKTTFAKGFAKGLGVKRIIQSPTFLLVRHYPLPITYYSFLYHIDAYRLRSGKDLNMLGWGEWAHNPKNIILVEWAERVREILPEHRFEIRFRHVDKNKRKVSFYVS